MVYGSMVYVTVWYNMVWYTVEARKGKYDCPPTPKPREEGTPAQIVPGPYSNMLECTVRSIRVVAATVLIKSSLGCSQHSRKRVR